MRPTHPSLTARELQRLYLVWAQGYYRRRRTGDPTREHLNIKASLDRFVAFAGEKAIAAKVNRHQLKAWIDQLAAEGLTRTYVNQCLWRVRRALRWAVDLNYIGPAVLIELQATRPLPAHRSAAREPEPRQAAPLDQVRAVLDYLPRHARDLVQLLMLTGARMGEILEATSADVQLDGEGPRLVPAQHKNAHRNRGRVIPLVPAAVAIIERRYKPLCPLDPLFPPIRRSGRPTCSGDAIRAAINRACARAGVPRFTPHQIRHAVARQVRASKGIEAARAMLGHTAASMTEGYSPLDFRAAQAAAEVLG